MPYTEDDLLMLSALQHILFCARQCALIHIEQVWVENLYTAQGRIMHERVDQTGRESRRNVRLEFGVPLRSLKLGLVGKADMIEFHRQEDETWLPYPVEYKRGRPKKENWDMVQLCAQAMGLEEMLDIFIPEGALFYGKNRRRQVVVFDDDLRCETIETAKRLHGLVEKGVTPPAVYKKKCDTCSLLEVCLPKVSTGKNSVAKYLRNAVAI
ncbi:CRISPR-associated protein Cas4 [Patescibacteria group bacterium]|nr:CRISPR-associated protein Cas4 [Patescibacteria group bacterium]